MKFTLEIELGNDAMRAASDVVDALRQVASTVEMYGFSEGINSSTVLDDNGNTVGKWEVVETPAAVPDICVPPTISEVIAQYPARFNLRSSAIPFGSPFDTFRIDPVASYRNDAGDVQLVLERNVTGKWFHFGKVYPAELDDNIVQLKS